MQGYAVVDVETTGFSPAWHDRVVEVAVVHVKPDGSIDGEWCTLVNPDRDMGPQVVHGIAAADVLSAPTFPEVAPYLGELLTGRLLVAHNLAFDALFLSAEFMRAGVVAPIDREFGLCTMRLAREFLTTATRSLASCCAEAGVVHTEAHSALGDARATAELFAYYLRCAGSPPPWTALYPHAGFAGWPSASGLPTFVPTPRGNGAVAQDGSWLDRLVGRLPRVPEPATADAYLSILDGALLDRHLSATEQAGLVALADDLGLTRDDVSTLHRNYLTALGAAARADGIVTSAERDDLALVGVLLGLTRADVDDALNAVSTITAPQAPFELRPGDRVVLTGEMQRPRDEWVADAEAAGLVVGGVAKKTRLVVSADPDSLSGKARKARNYRIPIVGEEAFAQLLQRMRQCGP
jgi:DNA polymerase-3 subunit epsilon